MTISFAGDTIALNGSCGVEEVDALVEHLENHPRATVDIDGAIAVHSALWQALMIYRPNLAGSPRPGAVGTIMPALRTFLDKYHAT